MTGKPAEVAIGRLERLCKNPGAPRIRIARIADGIEWAEAFFRDRAFAPHRHDTYAIGITIAGVQTFTYRGAHRCCLPGHLHLLHPDETHDGAPGTEAGFAYRILYVDPALIGAALGGGPLPFVTDPVLRGGIGPVRRMRAAIVRADCPLDEAGVTDLVVTLADGLRALSVTVEWPRPAIDRAAVSRVRAALVGERDVGISMAGLEAIAGLDRWTLARQFRAAYGTTPGRFRIMRRLERARRLIAAGTRLAEASVTAGFADQSHMTRQFKRAYGVTPARWVAALAT